MQIIQLILAIPEILRAVMALISFAQDQQAKKEKADADKLKREIEDAESEDDFRRAADGLSKLGRK